MDAGASRGLLASRRYGSQRPVNGYGGPVDVCLGVGGGQRTLLRGKGIEEDAVIDQRTSEGGVQSVVVISGEIMPIDRRVIHEEDNERAALPDDDALDTLRNQALCQALLKPGAELFEPLV